MSFIKLCVVYFDQCTDACTYICMVETIKGKRH